MMKFALILLLNLLCLKMPAFSQEIRVSTDETTFFNLLSAYCGNTYFGKVVTPLKDNDPFKGKVLKMHIQHCSETELRIPFHAGEDKSRTWIFTKTSNGLLFKHDHRHEDGTPDEITNYGGLANTATSKSFSQSFPADSFTANLIPAASTNEWTVVIDTTMKTMDYILKRDNKLRFQAQFKLDQNH
jgi:hypothetical protein